MASGNQDENLFEDRGEVNFSQGGKEASCSLPAEGVQGVSLVPSMDQLQQLQLTSDDTDTCPHPKSVALGSRKLLYQS